MVNTIDMQTMRYLNLFAQVTRVQTRYCFSYNNIIYFCVPRPQLSRAIGDQAKNIRRLSETLRKRVRVIAAPRDESEMKQFIESIVNPVTFQGLEEQNDEIILTAGSQSKAALLGRNKRRLLEMQKIIKAFFGKEFRIV